MDASQIIKLREKQNTTYRKTSQFMDSSTLVWVKQIQAASKLNMTPTTQNCNQQCKTTSIAMDSSQRYPDVFGSAKGSAIETYTSEYVLLQKAGANLCGTSTAQTSIVLPQCYCVNTNGPTSENPTPSINNSVNPYLPNFDTYYKYKNKLR
jgi:hypothetical protein